MQITEMSRVDWLTHFRHEWRQGQHIALIGPTGSGKTRLEPDLLAMREWVVVLAVKRHDDSLSEFRGKGYKIIRKWPPEYGQKRVILWVKPQTLDDLARQRVVLYMALQRIFLAGGWTVCFDDLSYMTEQLRIRVPVAVFMNQGRSSAITAVLAATRPRRVPIEAFNQTRYTISYHYDDIGELERVAEIAGLPKRSMVDLNQQLTVYPQGHSDFLVMGKGAVSIVRQRS